MTRVRIPGDAVEWKNLSLSLTHTIHTAPGFDSRAYHIRGARAASSQRLDGVGEGDEARGGPRPESQLVVRTAPRSSEMWPGDISFCATASVVTQNKQPL